jgi:flagellin-specific chaperone FliS
MMRQAYGATQYKQQEVQGASPIRLVVMAYDLAIVACDQKDFEKAVRTISALRDALDYDYPEVSGRLLRIYQWCLECIRRDDFASAKTALVELREAWAIVEKRLNTTNNVQITSTGLAAQYSSI